MRLTRNKKIIIGLVLVMVAGLIPLRAHAGAFDFLTFLSSATGITANDSFQTGFLHLALSILTPIQMLVLGVITTISGVLEWVINLRLDTGGQVVYAVWKILRDLCNMVFIVVIIVTSFGTIFNVFKLGFLSFYNIYNPKLVRGFLIAAIFINFSLAIGQSVVALSNHVTNIVVGLFPANIGGQITSKLNVVTLVATGKATTNVNFTAPGSTTATITQTGQSATALSDADKKRANLGWDNIFIGNYLNCVNTTGGKYTNASTSTLETCYARAAKDASKFPYPEVATAQEKIFITAGGNPPEVIKSGGFLGFSIGGQNVLVNDLQKAQIAVVENLGKPTDAGPLAAQVMGTLYSIFLLMILALSFLVVVIFMLIRIPAMWIILALSPLAWVGLLTPEQGNWKKWWEQFMAWNYFTPLYLGMIYLGLYLLSQQSNLLASLTTNPANASAIDGQLGVLLFYIMTGFVFIAGTAAVVKVSFAAGTSAGNVFGGITSRLGIDAKTGSPMGAVGAVYRTTGLANQVAGISGRIRQETGDLRANISGRFGGIPGLRTSEEALAAAQKRYGVRAGDKAFAGAIKKRVDTQKEIITAPLNRQMQELELKLAQTKTEAERKFIQDEIKKLKTDQEETLRKLLTSGNRDAAMAAGNELMAAGKLSADEIRKLGDRYLSLSQEASTDFIKRRDEQLLKDAEKREFKGDEKKGITPAAEMQSFMDLIGDNKQAKKFYDTALKGKNKVAAIETGVARGLLTDGAGNRLSVDQVVLQEAPKFKNNDWLAVDELFAERARKLSKTAGQEVSPLDEMKLVGEKQELFDLYARRLLNREAKRDILIGAKSGEQARRVGTVIQYAQDNEKELRRQEAQSRRFANEPTTKGAAEGEPQKKVEEESPKQTPK